MKSSQSGFTLIEISLVATLTILITLAVAIPISRFPKKKHLETTATILVSSLKYAQSLSISAHNGKAYGIKFSPHHYELFSTYPDQPYRLIRQTPIPSQLQLSVSFDPPQVTFAKLTGLPDNSGKITLSSNLDQLILQLSATGEINQAISP